jgi:hypothetical protein
MAVLDLEGVIICARKHVEPVVGSLLFTTCMTAQIAQSV